MNDILYAYFTPCSKYVQHSIISKMVHYKHRL